jgi:hypothetical protein
MLDVQKNTTSGLNSQVQEPTNVMER